MSALTGIEQTAWLTAFCRHWATGSFAFDADPFASWLAGCCPERAPRRVARRTRNGVAVRTALIDSHIRHVLRSAPGRWNYWSIGAGLDARWFRLADTLAGRVAEYREFDLAHLLEAKAALVARSPFAASYASVTRVPGDLLDTLESAGRDGRPTLAVVEGLMMYLAREQQERLFALLARASTYVVVIADVYSAFAVRRGNRERSRILGGADARFAWGPDDIVAFVEQQGWKIGTSESLTRRVLATMPPWRFVPLPARVKDSYLLIQASHGELQAVVAAAPTTSLDPHPAGQVAR
jgi:O-methyltransferase involved in polyketide biosynthesis